MLSVALNFYMRGIAVVRPLVDTLFPDMSSDFIFQDTRGHLTALSAVL